MEGAYAPVRLIERSGFRTWLPAPKQINYRKAMALFVFLFVVESRMRALGLDDGRLRVLDGKAKCVLFEDTREDLK